MSKTKKTTTSPEEPATIEDTSVNVTETAGRSGQRNKVSPKPAAIEILPEDGAAAPAAAEAETQPPVVMPETPEKKKKKKKSEAEPTQPADEFGGTERSDSAFVTIYRSTVDYFKNLKKKRKKFQPLPLDQAERSNPAPDQGLNDEQLTERYNHDLVNFVAQKYSKSYKSIFVGNICTFFNLLCAIVAVALACVHAELSNFFFVLIFLANILIGIIQEIRAKRTVEKLSLISSRSTHVIRNGVEKEISTREIVLDDVISFSIGNQISTDCIVMEGSIEVNESLLTGESVSVRKQAGDMLYAGSFVTGGNCRARAEKIGKENYVEKLSAKAKKYKKPHSELMHSMKMIITIVGIIIIPIAILMFLKNNAVVGVNEAVKLTATVIIGMIPSGMLLLTSMALAVGVIRLARNNTLTQDLYSLEMLARVDVLCLDKTGTITDGRMKVSDCIILNNNTSNTISEIMGSMLCALNDNNQTSIALYNHFGHNNSLKAVKILPFSSARKLSAVTFFEEGTYAFGAPEFVLKEIPEKLSKMINQYASMGLRVLVLAYSKNGITADNNVPANMKAIALITITDNIREDTVATIQWFKDNDVAVKVISGDNPVTVSEVARRVGIEGAEDYISLEGLSDRDVMNVASKYTVFGRVTPEQKAILIKSMKSAGRTVAMTGDGVNDILALKEADCAITVASGSDAARNVSHLVLMDSNFSSMPKVVHEGRRVINNIQHSASLYLMKTMFTMFLSVLMLIIPNKSYPFTPSMMLFLEIIIIGLASAGLSFQANDNRVEGKFISFVISRALPGAFLMVFSVMLVQLAQSLLGFEAVSPQIYIAMQVYAMTYAGLIMLFRICQPFNVFRSVLFSLVLVITLIWSIFCCMYGSEFLGLSEAMSPLSEYWQHILIVVCIVLIDVPLSAMLQNLAEKLRLQPKKPKNKYIH